MRLVAGVLLGLAPIWISVGTADDVKFQVEQGVKLEKTFETTLGLELDEISVQFGEEEIDPSELGEFEMSMKSERKLVFVDEYRAMEKDRPSVLVRTFETLTGSEVQTSSGDGESSEETSDEESELEGKTVLFQWSDEDDDWKKSFSGDSGDDELLANLVEDTDLRGFLPGKSVSEDDKWSVDAKTFNAIFEPGGDLALKSDDEDENSEEIDRQLDQNLGGEVTVTYKGIRDEGGARVAVLLIVADLGTFSESTSTEDEETTEERYELQVGVEGELLWDLERGRPHSYGIEGRVTVKIDHSSTMSFGRESFSMKRKMTLSGPTKFTGSWAVAE